MTPENFVHFLNGYFAGKSHLPTELLKEKLALVNKYYGTTYSGTTTTQDFTQINGAQYTNPNRFNPVTSTAHDRTI